MKLKRESLNSTIIKLGLVSFFADIASEMLYPVTPIFLTTILGASMIHLGFIEGVAEALASLLKIYSGAWSDKIRHRKPFIIFGYLLSTISKPLIGLSSTWGGVLSARAIDRFGKGVRTAPRDALIAESVDEKNRGFAFGWHRGMDTLGAAIGPLLSLYLLTLFSENLRPLYFIAVIPGAISVALIFLIHEPRHRLVNKKWQNPLLFSKNRNALFKKFMLACGVFALVNSSDVFLLLRAKEFGFSTTGVILLYCVYNLVYALSSPYLGFLSDSYGKIKILILGFSVYSLVYFGFAIADQTWHFWLLFLIYGLYMGATEGVMKAVTIDLAPKQSKATSVGYLGTITGICTIFASTIGGLIWDTLGSQYTFYYGAIGAFITILILLISANRITYSTSYH